MKGCQQAAGIDNRQLLAIRITDGSPVAMGQIDMGEGEGAGDKGGIAGVKLAFDPVGPNPVQVVLDDSTIDQAAGMKYHAGA